MLNNRVQILFDDNTLSALRILAKEKELSIGEIVRQSVIEKYFNNDKILQNKRYMAMQRIEARRRKMALNLTPEEIKDMINYGRKY